MATIGILGAGRVGSAIGRTALAAGFKVTMAASGAAEDIQLLVDIVVPGARAMTAADAVASADVVIVAVPLHKYRTVSPEMLAGKIVIDTMNYWAPVDGTLDDFEAGSRTSSEVIADHLAASRVVKTLNHIGYHELESDNTPSGTAGRRALAVASDDTDAAMTVVGIIDRFGFDPVYSGPLATGAAFEPGTVIFGGPHTVADLRREFDRADVIVPAA
ncbi:NADPH-dependent F420 reductase [Glaciibacter sp. 2TAF33]|uniref:NADPH-dependent F420 reductase n=1 Tax=Glaciibacter sp. 2TAF33 TaxID=3233015 RepID=UPI003F9272E6